MDEPTSALAVAEVEAVLKLINRVKAKGVAVILITHRLQDLFRVCDRIAVMYEGTKVAERDIGKTDLQDLVQRHWLTSCPSMHKSYRSPYSFYYV